MSERMYQERTIREDRISELAAVYEIKKDDPDCPPFVKKIGKKWERVSVARDKERAYWWKLGDAKEAGQKIRYWFYKKLWEKYYRRDMRITKELEAETSTPMAKELAEKYYLQYVLKADRDAALFARIKKEQEEAKKKAKKTMRKQKIRRWFRFFKNE